MTQHDTHVPQFFDDATRLSDYLQEAEGLLAGFDFDGTLAPIEEDPDTPELSSSLGQTLDMLARRENVQVAIVSGRELEDLRSRAPLDSVVYAGNHGLELYRDGERILQPGSERQRTTLREICTTLRSTLADIPGCIIEDKGLTLTVHVRQTPSSRIETVREEVYSRAATEPDLEVTAGKQVFEIRPNTPHDKGTAMESLMDDVPSDWLPIYVGDDTTDEDAFRAIQPEGIGIHVGSTTETAADYRLLDQTAVPSFVNWLITRLKETES